MTAEPHAFSANTDLLGERVILTRPDGTYLDDAQRYGDALYTVFGHAFSGRVVSQMRPDDAIAAANARSNVRA